MEKEQNATLTGLQTALQMEIDGKEFYLKASKAAANKPGKELLKKLAAEEDIHREVFQKIYESIKKDKGWPEVKYHSDGGEALETVFKKAMKAAGEMAKALPAELDAVKTAMAMENKTQDFYNRQKNQARYSGEKELYESLAGQEFEHHRVLQDYYEFLDDPAAWYAKTEHVSLDGG